MGRPTNGSFLITLFGTSAFLVSLTTPPLPPAEPIVNSAVATDWIDEAYLHFDSLRTDLSDYQWPTDASETMSSAFAEFRRTHFHGGIDISTRGRTGFRVFASRSGYIERIHVSPFGYGKMLQVRHEDGFVTLYAHLERFADHVQDYVRGFQYANERYSLDVRPEPDAFVVKKGDVIAFTGATGAGPPHLHFEIRDERTNPVNPLLFPHFAATVADTRAPEFRQISFAPFDHTGRINGSPLSLSLDARPLGNNEYDIPRTIRLNGAIGLSVRATDRVNATWHNNGVYHYELFLDSTLIYTSKLDRFAARLSEQIALHYDWQLVEAGEGRFQRLFLEPGNRLPLYSRSREKSGIIETAGYERGYHTLTIIARDIQGNQSRLKATLHLDEMPVIDVRKDGNVLVVAPSSQTNVSSITVASRSPGGRTWKRTSYEATNLNSAEDGYIVPVSPDDRRVFRIEAKTATGSVSHPVFFCPPTKTSRSTSLSLKKEFVRDYMLVTLTSHLPFTLRPSLRMTNGALSSFVEINAVDERTYIGTIPLSGLETTTVRLDAWGTVNGTDVETEDEFSVFPILPSTGGSIVAGDGEFEVDFPAEGVYQSLFVRIESTEAGYAAFPQDVLLNKGARVRYRQSIDDEKTGLYFVDGGDVTLLPADRSEEFYAAKVTKFLSEFTVRQDTTPPSISSLSVRHSRGVLRVRFGLRDNLSGLNADAIRVTVDERLLIAELDSDKKQVVFDERVDLEPGRHVLRIESRDKAGNTATAERQFTSAASIK
ncbi:MAG: M23 family metallopeptidase [Bacteroidota bacterium]